MWKEGLYRLAIEDEMGFECLAETRNTASNRAPPLIDGII